METKSLKSILKEKNYQVKGEQEKKKFSLACAEFIEQDNKAIWYYDLVGDLENYLLDLYNDKKIGKNSWCRRVLDYQIQNYIKNSKSKFHGTNEQISEIILKDNAKNYCKGNSFTLLDASKKINGTLFNIKNIYQILRENYDLKQEDELEISHAKDFVTKSNFEKVKSKALEYNDKKFNALIKKIDFGWKNLSESDLIYNNSNSEWPFPSKSYDYFEETTPEKLLGEVYFSIVRKKPIAYKDSQKAIEFFENETGINFVPKEYRKLVF